MNTQRIHRFCLALMVMAMLVRLAGQVEAYLDYKKASAPRKMPLRSDSS